MQQEGMRLLALVGRALLVLLLYGAAGYLGLLTIGAGISPQMADPADQARMNAAFVVLFVAAAATCWMAGLLWIGLAVDALAKRKASARPFLVLALICAVPQGLLFVADETNVLSYLTVLTWVLTPPMIMIALYRLIFAQPPAREPERRSRR